MTKVIEQGSKTCLHLTLMLEDGFVVEDTREDEPLCITIGSGELISGLEEVLLGMHSGEELQVTLGPEFAYGYRDDEQIHNMPRAEFSEDLEVEPGKIIAFTTPSGEEVAGTVLEVGEDQVKVDFNHPLAGRNVVFDINVLSIE